MDAVITNTAQFANAQSASTQLPRGSVQTTYSIVNQASIFAVSPSSLHDLRAELDGLLSRIHQYCVVEQSASLNGWWTGVLRDADTVYSVDSDSTQFILLSLALFVQSVDVVVWKRSSIPRRPAASSLLVESCRTVHLSIHLEYISNAMLVPYSSIHRLWAEFALVSTTLI